jgi:hypothetical protein
LTTNRVGVFDEAFKSRIHISLYYPELTWDQTTKIWDTHIKTAAKDSRIDLVESDLQSMANEIWMRQRNPEYGPVWNGRQIRNAFQSAVALAEYYATPGSKIKLEKRHFQRVFAASDEFSNYIWKVKKQHTDADWNKLWMMRRDDYVYNPLYSELGMQQAAAQGQPPTQSGLMAKPVFGQPRAQAGWIPDSTFGQSLAVQSTPFGVTSPQMAAQIAAQQALQQQFNPLAGAGLATLHNQQFASNQGLGVNYNHGPTLQSPFPSQPQQQKIPGYQGYPQQQMNYGSQGQQSTAPATGPIEGQQMNYGGYGPQATMSTVGPTAGQQMTEPMQPSPSHPGPNERAPGGFPGQMPQMPPP